jgi:hypothetical protein
MQAELKDLEKLVPTACAQDSSVPLLTLPKASDADSIKRKKLFSCRNEDSDWHKLAPIRRYSSYKMASEGVFLEQ